jgi:hypothetical protein
MKAALAESVARRTPLRRLYIATPAMRYSAREGAGNARRFFMQSLLFPHA